MGTHYLLIFLFLCFFSTVCISAPSPHRLSDNITVTQQNVTLIVSPDEPGFIGETLLSLHVESPSRSIAYHIRELEIVSVELMAGDAATGQTISILEPIEPDEYEIVRHTLDDLVQGDVSLKIKFKGKIGTKVEGLFRRESPAGNPYVFSQFQEMEARSVFPSLDEPGKKASFQFTLDIPAEMDALHNTRPLNTVFKAGRKKVQFAKTAIQSTDVLALAVGNFGAASLNSTTLNSSFYYPKGLDVKVPEETSAIVNETISFIEQYLDKPFPYDKLDFFVAPIDSLAAMENIGLIALHLNQLPDNSASSVQWCNYRKLLAHEIAHMWFGNDITMAWYDDIWMNESFAEFIAAKFVQHQYPENSQCALFPQGRAFSTDLPGNRKLKEQVALREDIASVGQLAYTKGRSILAMQEQAIGVQAFQQKMRQYVKKVSTGITTTDAWLAQFSEYPFMTAFVLSFLEQSGYPLITLSERGGSLVLSQESFHSEFDTLWTVPLTIREFDGKKEKQHQIVLSKSQQIFQPVNSNSRFFLDGAGVGYFRYLDEVSGSDFNLNRLSASEKTGMMDNASALAASSVIDFGDYLKTLFSILNNAPFESEASHHALGVLIDCFVQLLPESLLPPYRRLLKDALPVVEHWDKLAGGKNGGRWLSLYGIYLQDKEAVKWVRELMTEGTWRKHPARAQILRVFAMHATASEYQSLLVLFESADNHIKEDLLNALGYVNNKEKVKAFYQFLLSDKTQSFVIDYRFQFPAFQPRFRPILAEFARNNKQAITERIAIDSLQWFPYNFITACSEQEARLVEHAFREWTDVPGLTTKLSEVTDKISTCAASAEFSLKSIERLLNNRR